MCSTTRALPQATVIMAFGQLQRNHRNHGQTRMRCDISALLAIPGWCQNAELKANSSDMKTSPDANGFVRVERLWTPNDKTLLHFPMAPCMTTGRDANASGAPYASAACGPLLFALPIPDGKDANTPDPAANWQFALDAERDNPAAT